MGARPASTIVSKKYYQTTASYLRARSRTFNQKQTMNPISGNTYTGPSGDMLYPNSDPNSGTQPQRFYTGSCEDNPAGCNPTTVYKPNNRQFSTQGAVTSSTRMELLKLNAKNKEEKLWRQTQEYQQGIGMQNKKFITPCVDNLVNKPQFDMMNVKPGNPSSCFLTQVANMKRQPLTTNRVFGLSGGPTSSNGQESSNGTPAFNVAIPTYV